MMATMSSARGVRLGDGLQLLGCRRLHITILFLVSTQLVGLYCIPANAQAPAQAPEPAPITVMIFKQYEENALYSILQNWTQQNEELSRVLNWSLYTHPCNVSSNSTIFNNSDYEGAWRGVICTPIIRPYNGQGNYYVFDVSVTTLQLFGSNCSCGSDPVEIPVYPQCNFTGIKGVLPPEIGNLTNLRSIYIVRNPELTGPVPIEIWKLPYLLSIWLHDNSLIGTLPTADDLNNSSNLKIIMLKLNNFSGSLRVSSQGTLFSSSLNFLDLGINQLNGTVNLQKLNANASRTLFSLWLNNNNFSGTFSPLPSFNPETLNLHDNAFTDIKFANMSSLLHLFVANNLLSGPFPVEFLTPSLQTLDAHGNKYSGSLDFRGLDNISLNLNCSSIWLNNNNFSGTFSPLPSFNPETLNLHDNAFTDIKFANMSSLLHLFVANNLLSGPFPVEFLTPSLQTLDAHGNKYSGSLDFRGLDNISLNLNCSSMDFSNNSFNGSFFSGHFFNPKELDLSSNYFTDINFDVYNGTNVYMPSLESLYIQNNNLSGGQPPLFISEMPMLQILNIENNKFNGEFPEQLLKAPALLALHAGQNQYSLLKLPDIQFENFSTWRGVFLTNNSLGMIQYAPQGPYSEYNLQFSNSYLFLGGNPYCNNINSLLLSRICRMNPDQAATLLLNDAHKFSTQTLKIIIGTSTSTFGIVLLIIAFYVWRLMGRIQSLGIILKEFEKKEVKPNLYSYKEIKLATKTFDKRNKVGEGGFGVVYKGELLDGTVVAVKKLTMSSSQMLSEFLNEIVVISGLKHRNLVKLKGCCLGDGDQRMLVFEYVENKNLAEALLLHGDIIENFEPPFLDWATRYNIIVGIARGLLYLHEDSQSPVIHRDIKATNILLDKDFNAKIADFGLAYLFPTLDSEDTHLTLMQVAGTRGYCSPEYAVHGHVSTALDVYSFGILILEIISGRKCIDLQKSGEEVYLREWGWKLFEARVLITLIDSKMKHSPSDLEAITRITSVALACVQYKAAKRPKMHDVIPMLLGNMPIGNLHITAEDGEVLGGVASSSSTTRSDTTPSLWENDQLRIDECSLLSDIHEIELSARI